LVYSGSDAILKVRCSKGLHVKKTIPSKHLVLGTAVDSSELEFARVNADTCISFELEYDIGGIPKDNGMTSPLVYFQTALLYTTLTGHRRLRVSTLALPTTTSVTEAFQGIRFGPTCAIFIRKAIDDLYDPTDVGNLKRVGSLLTDRCVNVLSNYRNHTNAKHSACDTLAMPENLRLLPLFCLGLRKSLMLRSSLSKDATLSNTPFPNGDERAYRLFYGSRTTPVMSMICVHPTLFSILDMNADEGEWSRDLNRDTDQTSCIASHVFLPKPISPSVGILKPEGIYILDDGFTLFLFIGRDVSLERRAELLSYPCGSPQLQVSSALSKKIIRIVQQIRRYSSLGGTQQQAIRPVFSPLVLVVGTGGYGFRKGIDDILEKYMVECCVDDSSGGDSSYEDFLGEVHRRVNGKSI
jgi:protein transport protein SEC24